jgi:nucleoid-associated protein YgaU
VLGASIGEATPGSSGPGSHTVVVEFGDTLWSIAATQLGDPLAWRAIWRANRGLVTAPGSRFDEPGLLQPGWRLSIPGLPGAGSS